MTMRIVRSGTWLYDGVARSPWTSSAWTTTSGMKVAKANDQIEGGGPPVLRSIPTGRRDSHAHLGRFLGKPDGGGGN